MHVLLFEPDGYMGRQTKGVYIYWEESTSGIKRLAMHLNVFNDDSLMSSLRVLANVDEYDVARFKNAIV